MCPDGHIIIALYYKGDVPSGGKVEDLKYVHNCYIQIACEATLWYVGRNSQLWAVLMKAIDILTKDLEAKLGLALPVSQQWWKGECVQSDDE